MGVLICLQGYYHVVVQHLSLDLGAVSSSSWALISGAKYIFDIASPYWLSSGLNG